MNGGPTCGLAFYFAPAWPFPLWSYRTAPVPLSASGKSRGIPGLRDEGEKVGRHCNLCNGSGPVGGFAGGQPEV